MKKLLLSLTVLILYASSASALFVNGGFETGDFTGWTLEQADVSSSTLYGDITWNAGSNGLSDVITAGTLMMSDQTLDVDPYNGTYMARINDLGGGDHATQISQTGILTTTDLTKKLYVNWGAMITDPVGHPSNDQPNFGIAIFINNVETYKFTADGDAASTPGSGWVTAGSSGFDSDPIYYKSDTWSYDLSSLSAGNSITVKMWVTDCGQGAHGGAAFLDGIGTEFQPPSQVPEPASMLLFGLGLLGIAGIRRKV